MPQHKTANTPPSRHWQSQQRNGGKKTNEGSPARKIYQTNKAMKSNTTGSVDKPTFQVGLRFLKKHLFAKPICNSLAAIANGQGDDDIRLLLIMSNDIQKTRIRQPPIYTFIYSFFFFYYIYVIKIYN
jgi:hypothetical protein